MQITFQPVELKHTRVSQALRLSCDARKTEFFPGFILDCLFGL